MASRRPRHPILTAGGKVTLKRTLFLGAALGVFGSAVYLYKSHNVNVSHFRAAYEKVPELIRHRRHHHQIPLVSLSSGDPLPDDASSSQNIMSTIPFRSVEPMTVLDASDKDNVIAFTESKSNEGGCCRRRLGALDTRSWPDFLASLGDDDSIYVTMGSRRAFGHPLDKLGLLHAVVLVQAYQQQQQKTQIPGKFLVAGYNAGKLAGRNHRFFLNDMNNEVSRILFFTTDLSIKMDSKQQAIEFFEYLEAVSEFRYRLFTCNCFSPVILSLAKFAKFRVCDYFLESLLVTVPLQSNLGFGTSSNPVLRPMMDLAAASIFLLVNDFPKH